mmetsp:Transcript_30344/g.91863  ORF Transcript_30344/g.91863 Transcript_30344/m.91863 type:complete len:201 (+) Transcript_30344:866-1468(+)
MLEEAALAVAMRHICRYVPHVHLATLLEILLLVLLFLLVPLALLPLLALLARPDADPAVDVQCAHVPEDGELPPEIGVEPLHLRLFPGVGDEHAVQKLERRLNAAVKALLRVSPDLFVMYAHCHHNHVQDDVRGHGDEGKEEDPKLGLDVDAGVEVESAEPEEKHCEERLAERAEVCGLHAELRGHNHHGDDHHDTQDES